MSKKLNSVFQIGAAGPIPTDSREPVNNVQPECEVESQLGPVSSANLAACSTPDARSLLSYELAQKLQVLPLGLFRVSGNEFFTVAAVQPVNSDVLAALRFASGKEVKLITVNTRDLDQAIFKAYHGDQTYLRHKVTQLKEKWLIKSAPKMVLNEMVLNEPACLKKSNGETSQMLNSLIDFALARSASDLHFIPRPAGCFVKIRIDGQLLAHEEALGSLAFHAQLINRIKILARMDTAQHFLPQDGSFKTTTGGQECCVRVNIMPTVHGEKAALRLNGAGALMPLENLGLNRRTDNSLSKCLRAKEGAILFAGPTGSGKSTTMYAIMQALTGRNLNLVSIEDPVEVQLEGVVQTTINDKTGLDYTSCLSAVLRQDPDVILLGEIRDKKSAQIAFQAALTGHLLLSTVHARNVFEVFMRLENLEVDSLMMAQTIKLIVCQRLLPRLCQHCRVFDLKASHAAECELYKPVGCSACDYSGYLGRELALESLSVDGSVSAWLGKEKRSCQELRRLCTQHNYSPLKESLAVLLKAGKISLAQVNELEAVS